MHEKGSRRGGLSSAMRRLSVFLQGHRSSGVPFASKAKLLQSQVMGTAGVERSDNTAGEHMSC